jgi:hypothetical protein
MSSHNNSLQDKKLYLKQMSQHFKEMAGKQDDETRKVIAFALLAKMPKTYTLN